MKKVWAIALVTVLCITVLTGCKSNADMSVNAGSDADSQVVSEACQRTQKTIPLASFLFDMLESDDII